MTERIKTLVLEANGRGGGGTIATDTVLQGILRAGDGESLPAWLRRFPPLRRHLRQRYEALSYVADWREALCEHPLLDVRVCRILNLVDYLGCRRAIGEYPLVIVLHSAGHGGIPLLRRTAAWFRHRRGKLVVFVGNEYKRMAEKIAFIRAAEADFACSQLPLETARWLYREAGRTRVLSMPHALNPAVYYPAPGTPRTVDIGFVGDLYHDVIGDMERTNLVRYFEAHGRDLGLTCDIRTERLPRSEWAGFLRACKGIVGAESGTYYLDRSGAAVASAEAYSAAHPSATFDEVFANSFGKSTGTVSGKAISPRHFEAIGTKTCQLLVEGDYNGILAADEHYIAVKKDLSNIDDAIRRFRDDAYRNAMVERAYDYVMAGHTYRHRVESLLRTVDGV